METTHSHKGDTRVAIGEAARRLGVAVGTVRRWEAEGKISSTRTIGNQRRYLVSDVEQLGATTPAVTS